MAEPLARQLVFAGKAMREAFEAAMADAGGSLATWIVLSAVNNEVGFINQSVLASRVRLEGATITHHVDRLEQQGLVRRRPDPGDRRVRHVELTPAGEKLHAELMEAAKAFESRALAGVSQAARAQLRDALEQIRSNLASARTSGGARARR
jgi:MarR family transcriptional regulator for hemolysin